MATPVTAGNVAVARQYFRGGFFAGASATLDAAVAAAAVLSASAMASLPLTGGSTNAAAVAATAQWAERSGLYQPPGGASGGPPGYAVPGSDGSGGGSSGSDADAALVAKGGFVPPAALVKAVLVAGAAPLGGRVCTGSGGEVRLPGAGPLGDDDDDRGDGDDGLAGDDFDDRCARHKGSSFFLFFSFLFFSFPRKRFSAPCHFRTCALHPHLSILWQLRARWLDTGAGAAAAG